MKVTVVPSLLATPVGPSSTSSDGKTITISDDITNITPVRWSPGVIDLEANTVDDLAPRMTIASPVGLLTIEGLEVVQHVGRIIHFKAKHVRMYGY